MEAANINGSWAHCIYCQQAAAAVPLPKGISPASNFAQTACSLLQRLHGVQLIITEARVLGGNYGGFDFSVKLSCPDDSRGYRRPEVEVDGEQHFTKTMHNTTVQQQRAADRRKDGAAWEAHRCLVRLHYADEARWLCKLWQAVRRATQPARSKFIMYTISYGLKDRVAAYEVRAAGGAVASNTHFVLHWVVIAFGE